MKYNISPLVKDARYLISRQQLNQMKKTKKHAPGYNENGQKVMVKQDDVLHPKKLHKQDLVIRRYRGPLLLVLFQTPDGNTGIGAPFVYHGYVLIEEGDKATVWLDSSMRPYTDVDWTDDDVLLCEVRQPDKATQAFQFPGEPTNIENFTWSEVDDENHFHENMVRDKIKQVASKLDIDEKNAVGIVMLDC